MERKRAFIILSKDSFLLSHRKEIVVEAVKRGLDVTVVAKDTGCRARIEALGADFVDFPVNPVGMNPIQELKSFWFLYRLLKKHKPDVVHNVGLKPMLWGGLAAKLVKIPRVINAVSGLGIMFSQTPISLKARGILSVLRFAHQRQNVSVIFQNHDDEAIFLDHDAVKPEQVVFIKGSGVDLETFGYTPETVEGKLKLIFVARMTKEKGVLDLIEAAKTLKNKYEEKIEFWLCGGLSDNPLAVTEAELTSLCDGSYIKWLGHRSDILHLLQKSNIVVFPSYYREGVPKSLIEACAIGRPIVTTDSVGCRDCVEDQVSGFLVPIKTPQAIADRLELLINDPAMRESMGKAARKMAERDFSIEHVVNTHLNLYTQI